MAVSHVELDVLGLTKPPCNSMDPSRTKRSIRGYKSSLTRHCNDATVIFEDEIVSSTRKDAEDFLRKLNEKYQTLVEAIEKATIEGDGQEDWTNILDEGQCQYQKLGEK